MRKIFVKGTLFKIQVQVFWKINLQGISYLFMNMFGCCHLVKMIEE